MITLILETSSEKGLLALAHKGELLFSRPLPIVGKNSTTLLLEALQAGAAELQIDVSNLGCVACGLGPGFFTGIRVAASFAKGLALGLGIPLVGFSSLSGFISLKEALFASVIDARVGGAYLLLQENVGGGIEESSSVEYFTYADLEKKVANRSIISPSIGKMPFQNVVEEFPNASHLAQLVEKKIQNQEFSLDGELPLSYLRPCV